MAHCTYYLLDCKTFHDANFLRLAIEIEGDRLLISSGLCVNCMSKGRKPAEDPVYDNIGGSGSLHMDPSHAPLPLR